MKTLLLLISLVSCIPSLSQDIVANKRVVTRYFEEVINKKKLEALCEIYSEDYTFHSLENGEDVKGLSQLDNFLPMFFKAFPDIHYTIDRIVAEGDPVVVQCTEQELKRPISFRGLLQTTRFISPEYFSTHLRMAK